MEHSFCSHPNCNEMIATKICTWHSSCVAMACAKFCCDIIAGNWITAKWNFHRIWIMMENSLVKWVPGQYLCECHGNWAVVACANFRLDVVIQITIKTTRMLNKCELWVYKTFVKWVSGSCRNDEVYAYTKVVQSTMWNGTLWINLL